MKVRGTRVQLPAPPPNFTGVPQESRKSGWSCSSSPVAIAAKCHLRLDLQSLLPRFAIVDTNPDGITPKGTAILNYILGGLQ